MLEDNKNKPSMSMYDYQLRDQIATQAMVSLIRTQFTGMNISHMTKENTDDLAQACYAIADSMMEVRSKETY